MVETPVGYLYVRFRVTPNVMRYEMKVKSLPYMPFLFGCRGWSVDKKIENDLIYSSQYNPAAM